jgi:hypothetical protein
MDMLQDVARIALIGTGATAIMDIWLALLKRMGVQTLDFALIGRWIGHLGRGRFAHAAIGRASPIPGELAWGWLTHYAVGIAFAGVLVGAQGLAWVRSPSVLPALVLGLCSVAAPFFVMQPAMGAGFAASKTSAPLKNRIRSIANHAVFGLGLYLAAVAIAWVLP